MLNKKQDNSVQLSKNKPITLSIEAKSHTPQYRMHKYFARRPYNVFKSLIEHYSSEQQIVLDCFCGGGVTIFEAVALKRKAIGIDINPLAVFITKMQMFNGDLQKLEKLFSDFISELKKKYSDYYFIQFDDDEGYCDWTEWAYKVKCEHCGNSILLTESNKKTSGIYYCSNIECKGNLGVKRINCIPDGSIPIKVKYFSSKYKDYRIRDITCEQSKTIMNNCNIQLAEGLKEPNFVIPMNWDRQLEDGLLARGIKEYKDFFTKRNYALNVFIFNELLNANRSDNELNDYLYFLFSSTLRYSNNMTRVTDNWEGGKPTSFDKHAFWLPNQYIETNIIHLFEKRAETIIKGCHHSKSSLPNNTLCANSFKELQTEGNYLVLNQSSSIVPFPDSSIDVIITDPPYGSNVQYAELSVIWNAWFKIYKNLGSYIYNDDEAIINRKLKNEEGAKNESDYEMTLYNVFKECYRLLKNNGYLVFTFNNKNVNVWIAMLSAVAKAGFILPENGIVYQDFIQSYKNTSHLKYAGNIHGDFIYSFQKCKISEMTAISNKKVELNELIEKTITSLIQELFKDESSYSTQELYQKIFFKLASLLMEHIKANSETTYFDKKSKYSNDIIETYLKKYLVFNNNSWMKRI